MRDEELNVVIPIQTISFYNVSTPSRRTASTCCHTYPNDKLLQRRYDGRQRYDDDVVIPIQTISFYNKIDETDMFYFWSCHTYPNDKLLQPMAVGADFLFGSCHTYPNDKLLQHSYLKDFEEVVWHRSDVSLYPNALISKDLVASRTRFSQMPCFFIVKCWVFIGLIIFIFLIFKGLAFRKKFANDSLFSHPRDSCEICSRFQGLSNVQN